LSGNLITTGSRIDTLSGNLITTGSRIDTLSGNLITTGSRINTLSGNLITTGSRIDTLSGQVVFTTGNQTISGTKTFIQDTTFGDTGQGDFLVISGNNFTVYGSGNFTSGLFVNGTGVLLSGQTAQVDLSTTVRTTGNQNISGVKNFFSRVQVDGTGVLLSGEAAPKDIATTVNISSNTISLNLNAFSYFLVNLNNNITTTNFNNPKAAPEVTNFVLQLSGDGTIRSVTWPTSLRWPGSTAPTITIGPNKVDTYSIFSYDGGVSYYGFPAGYNS